MDRGSILKQADNAIRFSRIRCDETGDDGRFDEFVSEYIGNHIDGIGDGMADEIGVAVTMRIFRAAGVI